MNPVRSLARAKGASPEDLGGVTSNGMNDQINEVKQDEVVLSPIPEVEPTKINKLQMILKKLNRRSYIIIVVAVLIVVSAYAFRSTFIAATVNGSPISRFAVISKLEKNSGKQILDSLITDKLVVSELDKNKITATNEEINADIKTIEDKITGQGSTLAQVLTAQGMTSAELREQISTNIRIKKLFSDKIQVSDSDVSQYIKDNKLTVPKVQTAQYYDQVRNQLKTNKLSQVAKDWVTSLRSQASIQYLGNY